MFVTCVEKCGDSRPRPGQRQGGAAYAARHDAGPRAGHDTTPADRTPRHGAGRPAPSPCGLLAAPSWRCGPQASPHADDAAACAPHA